MAITDFIAAIELSSSQVRGIAGRKGADGSIQVLAYAQEPASAFVHKGIVRNVEKAAQTLDMVITQLEQQLQAPIARIYTGIGGQSLRTVKNVISRDLPDEGIITQEIIDSIRDENRQVPLVDMDVLDVAPQEYRVDHQTPTDPVGTVGRHITATFLNMVARSVLQRNLEMAFQQAEREMADLFVSPLATARTVLTEAEMRSGCALVDLGADTTTVSVYKNGILRYLAVIPLGSSNITRDLTALRIEDDEAEALKRQYADALYVEENADEPVSCQTADGRAVALSDLCDIVGARTEEILSNALAQISLSGFEDRLLSGVILTGGGANLKNVEEAVRRLAKDSSLKIKTVRTPRMKLIGRVEDLSTDGSLSSLIGLLASGREDCRGEEREPAPAEQPAKPVAPPEQAVLPFEQPTDSPLISEDDQREKSRTTTQQEKRSKKVPPKKGDDEEKDGGRLGFFKRVKKGAKEVGQKSVYIMNDVFSDQPMND